LYFSPNQIGKLNNIITGVEITLSVVQSAPSWRREKEETKTFGVTTYPHSYIVFQAK
jgi:hypothetical protein